MPSLTPLLLNNAYGTVQAGSSAIGSATATGVNVAAGQGAAFGTIGTNEYVPAVIVDTSTNPETVKEYVWITAVSTDALTVVRQAEESTRYPASTSTIQAGYVVAAVSTASTLRCIVPEGDYFRTGAYVRTVDRTTFSTNATPVGRIYAVPLVVPVSRAFDRIGCEVTTANASSTIRLGVYAGEGGVPGTLLLNAGTASGASTGAQEITISQTLAAGLYWLAVLQTGTAATLRAYAPTTYTPFVMNVSSIPGDFASTYTCYRSSSGQTDLPSTFPQPGALTGAAPVVELRAA